MNDHLLQICICNDTTRFQVECVKVERVRVCFSKIHLIHRVVSEMFELKKEKKKKKKGTLD